MTIIENKKLNEGARRVTVAKFCENLFDALDDFENGLHGQNGSDDQEIDGAQILNENLVELRQTIFDIRASALKNKQVWLRGPLGY